MASLSVALKEWHVACEALLAGRQAVLLRKGGIHEAAGEFELQHRAFLLFPTFLHQKREMVKQPFRAAIAPVAAEPATVQIDGFCRVRRIFEVPGRAELERLDDLHLYAPPLLDMRFAYRPDNPLYLVVVQAYRLAEGVAVPNTPAYAGCKSWVPLEQEITTDDNTPALPAQEVDAIAARVAEAFRQDQAGRARR